jgi:hypothetical protein
LQEVVVVPNYVTVVSCETDIGVHLNVYEVCIESPVEIDWNDNELQEVVVVPNHVAGVRCEKNITAQLYVSEGCADVESPVEMVHTGECMNVGVEVSLRVVEYVYEGEKLDV